MKKFAWLPAFFVFLSACSPPKENQAPKIDKVILISANAEWRVVQNAFPNETVFNAHWGEYFITELAAGDTRDTVVFFHGGWGKVAAAGSAQYCIDQWNPKYIINIGTCGGFEGQVKKFDVILVDKTVIYDVLEAMGDSQQAISDYTTSVDLSWLATPYPTPVTRTLLVSADKDLVPAEISKLQENYHAVAGDWESGAIAYTCAKNQQRLLILRGVSDMVSAKGSEASGNKAVYVEGTEVVMKKLLADLPLWLARCP